MVAPFDVEELVLKTRIVEECLWLFEPGGLGIPDPNRVAVFINTAKRVVHSYKIVRDKNMVNAQAVKERGCS